MQWVPCWQKKSTNSENRTANKTNTEEVSNSGQASTARTSSNSQTVNETGTGKNLESDLPQINYNNVDYGTNLNESETSTATTTAGTGSENNTNTLTANQNSSKTESMENEMAGHQSKDEQIPNQNRIDGCKNPREIVRRIPQNYFKHR